MAIGSIAKFGGTALKAGRSLFKMSKRFGNKYAGKTKKAFGRSRRGLSSGRGGSFGAKLNRGVSSARKGFGRAAGSAGGKFSQLSEKQKKFLFASGILGGVAGAGGLGVRNRKKAGGPARKAAMGAAMITKKGGGNFSNSSRNKLRKAGFVQIKRR